MVESRLQHLLLKNVVETNKILGEGSYGVVYEVLVAGSVHAGKKLHSVIVSKATIDSFIRECCNHSEQCHINIVQLTGVHFSPNSDQLPMLIMEYLPLSLAQCLETQKNIAIETKYSILLDVANGLNYLHNNKPSPIVHRDLTANNILLTFTYMAKISDLGVSKMIESTNPLTQAPGNLSVMPPEALKDNPQYDFKLDIFSYGCVALHILTHEWPIPSEQFVSIGNDLARIVSEWDRRSKYTTMVPSDNPLLPFIKKCLCNNPRMRPLTSEAVKCSQDLVDSYQKLVINSELTKDQMEEFLHAQQYQTTFVPLSSTSEIYKLLENILHERLVNCPHSFHLSCIEAISVHSENFYLSLSSLKTPSPHFLFYGTNESGHLAVCFNTSEMIESGHLGKGIYLSSCPEFSAAFIKNAPGIKFMEYNEPVSVGVTCKLLGCIALVGCTRQVFQSNVKATIETDSHWALVDKNRQVMVSPKIFLAQEFVIKNAACVYPRFRISLTRVTKEVVWVDPNISNSENNGYVAELKQEHNLSLYATSNSTRALTVLGKKKQGVQYRAITAGSGGEEFIKSLRSAGINCKTLVFCGAVDYHKQWAKNFENVEVTNSTATFKKFATWKE